MASCDTCGEWVFQGLNHRCENWYRVFVKEQYDRDGEKAESSEIAAHDHQDAAEKWASLCDRERLYCDRSSSEDVVVIDVDNGSIKRFRVRGEVVPQYYARPLEDRS